MPQEIIYPPPQIECDDPLERQFTRIGNDPPVITPQPHRLKYRSAPGDPRVDYARILTPDGGILILYRDLASSGLLTACRIAFWSALTAFAYWQLKQLALSGTEFWLWFALICAFNLFVASRKIKVRHSVAVHHDRMILDGKHVFWASHIGQNWPQLQVKDEENPDRMVIAGLYGTRWVEFMTANRIDKNDRTPELLAQHLQDAMQQLWGRSELNLG